METKFKVGDKVRVKSLEWYNNNKNINEEIIAKEGKKFGVFTKYMRPWCGDVIKINSVINGSYRANNGWCWYDWMLEDEPVTEEKQEVEQLNKNNMETKQMTKKEIFAYLGSTKILCTSTEETEKVQKKLFELGIGWSILGTSVANKYLLFINDDRLEFTPDIDYWVRSEKKRIEPSEILLLELKEEKPKFNPSTLQDFDKVLVRNDDGEFWCLDFYDSYRYDDEAEREMFYSISGLYMQCVPYNEETKHLKGTTEEAPEFYKIWE